MSLEVTFTLNDEDLQRFQNTVDKARSKIVDETSASVIEEASSAMISKISEYDLPAFISERFLKLQILLNMIRDQEWQLNDSERHSILCALYYLCDPDDVIPDHIPGLGYLDDAIYTEIVTQELSVEIKSYQEFCQFRIAEENRRRNNGLDPHVGREDWIADKRAVLQSRMRERRLLRTGGRGWRLRLFS